MSQAAGFDFAQHIDCCGGNMWVWSRTANDQSFLEVKPAECKFNEADLPENWIELHTKRTDTKSTDTSNKPKPSIAKVVSALMAIPVAEDYGTWFKIVRCFKSEGDQLFGIFDTWSSQAKNYGKTREKWNTITPDGGITIGTLFHLAKQHGWTWTESKPTSGEELDTFKVLDSSELVMGDFDVEYRIEDCLVKGQPCLAGGPSKALKTTTMTAMAIALASKRPFLGKYKVNEQCRVLMMSGESGTGTLQETAIRICHAQGLDLFDLNNLKWSEDLPTCDDPASLAEEFTPRSGPSD